MLSNVFVPTLPLPFLKRVPSLCSLYFSFFLFGFGACLIVAFRGRLRRVARECVRRVGVLWVSRDDAVEPRRVVSRYPV